MLTSTNLTTSFQQRPADPFGATPFLPPPPASSKSNRGSQGRYQFPPATVPGTTEQQQQQQPGIPQPQGPSQGNDVDRYAVFDSLLASSSSNGFGPSTNSVQHTQGSLKNSNAKICSIQYLIK